MIFCERWCLVDARKCRGRVEVLADETQGVQLKSILDDPGRVIHTLLGTHSPQTEVSRSSVMPVRAYTLVWKTRAQHTQHNCSKCGTRAEGTTAQSGGGSYTGCEQSFAFCLRSSRTLLVSSKSWISRVISTQAWGM